MSSAMIEALNVQINNELYSAYLYLGMAAHFQSKNLVGFSKWFKLQAQEETMHAMKIYNFIIDRGWQVTLLPIKNPEGNWNSPTETFIAALNHEEQVTKMINNLYKLAIDENDYASSVFLQWFVNEQVEEEAMVSEILSKIKLAETTPHALLFIDAELGKRSNVNNKSEN